jgi:hypothetical protein
MDEKRKREYERLYQGVENKFDRGDITLDVMWQRLCELDDEYL